MPPEGRGDDLGALLAEQAAYYRALAPEYENQALTLDGRDELVAALEAFRSTGDVLELACGPGVWTGHLLASAAHVTAVDASPEMLGLASARYGGDRVGWGCLRPLARSTGERSRGPQRRPTSRSPRRSPWTGTARLLRKRDVRAWCDSGGGIRRVWSDVSGGSRTWDPGWAVTRGLAPQGERQ